MTDVTHDLNQAAETAGLLIQQFKTLPNISGLAKIFGAKVQEIEDALWQLFTLRGVNTASGISLDNLGEIVGVVRGGLSDTDYANAIRAEILINISSGTAPQILAILSQGFPLEILTLKEFFPGSFVVYDSHPTTTAKATLVGNTLQAAKPAGVAGQLQYSTVVAGLTFTDCDSNLSQPILSSSLGYADSSAPGTGGHYAGAA